MPRSEGLEGMGIAVSGPKLNVVIVEQSWLFKKYIDLYTLNRWIMWYVIYILMQLYKNKRKLAFIKSSYI